VYVFSWVDNNRVGSLAEAAAAAVCTANLQADYVWWPIDMPRSTDLQHTFA
jgi:hypothetical protein